LSVRIVLVGTTHPGNIGAVARAMKNMGQHDLVLVNPRHFPHEDATARASGADDILQNARVVDTLEEAVADCGYVAGASARSRTIGWPSMVPRECAERLLVESGNGKVAVVFGPENSGLSNDHLDLCQTLLTIPTDPGFSSLNLAMAVQVLTYEIRVASMENPEPAPTSDIPSATGEEMEHFYTHLEQVMISSGFLKPENPRHLMRRLRRLFARVEPDRDEINILRGILGSLDPDRRDGKDN
jgi:TrmH family RNA methyltransferase